jgi:hypothetical protein
LERVGRHFSVGRLNVSYYNTAQDVQRVLPEIVKIAPFDLAIDEDGNKTSKSGENYLTLSYERLAPVFVEAIKELKKEIAMLKQRVAVLENKE